MFIEFCRKGRKVMVGINFVRRVTVHLPLVLVSALMISPLFFILNIALKTKEEFLKYPFKIASSMEWGNFLLAWNQANMGTFYKNSFIYAFGSAFVVCLTAAFAAYPLSRSHFKWANVIYIMFMVSLFLPVSIIPVLFLMKYLQLMNTYHGFILYQAGNQLGLAIFIFYGFIKSIPKELDEAASVDGCGYLRYISSIILPIMKPSIVTVMMLACINSWNDFIGPYLYLSKPNMRPLTSGLYLFIGQFSIDWTVLTAGIIIVASPLIILYIFLQKFIISGIASGAVKG